MATGGICKLCALEKDYLGSLVISSVAWKLNFCTPVPAIFASTLTNPRPSQSCPLYFTAYMPFCASISTEIPNRLRKDSSSARAQNDLEQNRSKATTHNAPRTFIRYL